MAEDSTGSSQREDVDDIIRAGLVAGLSYPATGELAGVHARTVQRRMRDASFAASVAEGRAARVSEIAGQLGERALKALAGLDRLMDPSAPVAVQKGAVDSVLRSFLSYHRAADVEPRLRQVEARLEELLALLVPDAENTHEDPRRES